MTNVFGDIPALVHMLPEDGNHVVHPDHNLMRMACPAAVIEGHTLLLATLLCLSAWASCVSHPSLNPFITPSHL